VVFWTHTMEKRAKGWLSNAFHHQFRELMLHTAGRYDLLCPVYCLMPDHIHLVWLGTSVRSDQRTATRFLRKHMKMLLKPAELQRQPHDHVLREEERVRGAFQSTCHYVQENPVRKGLVRRWEDYPYLDCIMPGYPDVARRNGEFWQQFWRIYEYILKNDSGRNL